MAYSGVIQSTTLFFLLAACSCFAVGLAWLVCIILVVERRMDRKTLAAAVEHDHDMLQDRLNTVVELDQRINDDCSAAIYRNAIEEQATGLVPKLRPANPLKKRSVNLHLLVMLLLVHLQELIESTLRLQVPQLSVEATITLKQTSSTSGLSHLMPKAMNSHLKRRLKTLHL